MGQPSRAPPTPARNLDATDLQRQLGSLVREAPELQAQVGLCGQQCSPQKVEGCLLTGALHAVKPGH